MDLFIRHGYKGKKLSILNECRMFLRVVCLSDILDMSGEKVEPWAYDGKQHPTSYGCTTYEWPRCPPRLPADHWNQWQAALQETVLLTGSSKSCRLSCGPWESARVQLWEWWYHPASNRLYHKNNQQWQMYQRLPTQSSRLTSHVRSYMLVPEIEGVTTADGPTWL